METVVAGARKFERISDKSHEEPTTKKLSWSKAIRDMFMLEAATSLVVSLDALKGPYENIGIVSALLLTMVQLGHASDVGAELISVDFASDASLILLTLNTFSSFAAPFFVRSSRCSQTA
jgi:hypothetical protein